MCDECELVGGGADVLFIEARSSVALCALRLQKQSLGSTLMDEVFSHIDLLEKDFFGLACTDKGMGLVSAKCLNITVEFCLSLYVTVCIHVCNGKFLF